MTDLGGSAEPVAPPNVEAFRAEFDRAHFKFHYDEPLRDLVMRLLATLEWTEGERGSWQRVANAWERRAVEAETREHAALARAPQGDAPPLSDEQLLAAFVAGCNAENELSEAELSPQNVRKGVAAAMRGELRGGASSSGSAPAGSPPHDPPREPTHYAVGPRWPIGGPYPCGREAEERGAAHCSTVAWGVDCVKCLRALVERGAAPAPPPPDDFAQFATDARTELDRADEKWPDGDVYLRLAALAGEVGELAEGVIKQRAPVELRAEAVQVAVTAYRVARVLFAGVRVGASAPTPEPEPLRAALTKIANWMPTRLPHTQGEAEAFHAVREYAETVVRGVGSPQPAPDVTWRKLLWLRHGCPIHTLYGDDGEMQCGICGIDFLRLSAAEIETYWRNASLRQLAGASPQPPREETK